MSVILIFYPRRHNERSRDYQSCCCCCRCCDIFLTFSLSRRSLKLNMQAQILTFCTSSLSVFIGTKKFMISFETDSFVYCSIDGYEGYRNMTTYSAEGVVYKARETPYLHLFKFHYLRLVFFLCLLLS